MNEQHGDKQHDYPALCRSLAAWLIGESQGAHRELKRGETADRLLEIAARLSTSSAAASSVVPAGYKLLKDSTFDERSWKEDASHENGNYYCNCCVCQRQFLGHKRRVLCKVCDVEEVSPYVASSATTAIRDGWIWSLEQPEVSGWRWIETWSHGTLAINVMRFHVGDSLPEDVSAWRYVDPPSNSSDSGTTPK